MLSLRGKLPALLDVFIGAAAIAVAAYLMYVTGWEFTAASLAGWAALLMMVASFACLLLDVSNRFEKTMWGYADAMLSVVCLFLAFVWGYSMEFFHAPPSLELTFPCWLLLTLLFLYSVLAVFNLLD